MRPLQLGYVSDEKPEKTSQQPEPGEELNDDQLEEASGGSYDQGSGTN